MSTTAASSPSSRLRRAAGVTNSEGRCAAGGALAVDVLNGGRVPPDDLLARQAEDGGDLVAFGGARRPAPQDDGEDALLVQAALFGELPGVDAVFLAELGNALEVLAHRHTSHDAVIRPRVTAAGGGLLVLGVDRIVDRLRVERRIDVL